MVTKTVKQMCCVRIGFVNVLLPADAGLRVVALLKDAVAVDMEYTLEKAFRITGESLEISLTVVKPSQVIPARAADSRRLPALLLTHD
jgi:hypothetical protein